MAVFPHACRVGGQEIEQGICLGHIARGDRVAHIRGPFEEVVAVVRVQGLGANQIGVEARRLLNELIKNAQGRISTLQDVRQFVQVLSVRIHNVNDAGGARAIAVAAACSLGD